MAHTPPDFTEEGFAPLTLSKVTWSAARLMGQGVAALTLAVLGAQVDNFHRLSMGPLYLALVWTCLWSMVAVGWMFLGYACWSATVGLVVLDRLRTAWVVLLVGGTVWGLLTVFIIGTVRTFISSI